MKQSQRKNSHSRDKSEETEIKIEELVRGLFSAYQQQDRDYVEQLLSDDFRFSSPQDDNIDRKAYFEKCWPMSETTKRHHLQKVFVIGNEAFVLYDLETTEGSKYRNTEFFTFESGKLHKIEVFFGPNTENRFKNA